MTDPLNIRTHCRNMLIEQIMVYYGWRNLQSRAFLENSSTETLSAIWRGIQVGAELAEQISSPANFPRQAPEARSISEFQIGGEK